MHRACAFLLLALTSSAAANEFRVLPYPDRFALVVDETIRRFQPADAFSRAADCAVVDRRYIRQPSVEEAREMLRPCLGGLSASYGFDVRAERAAAAPAGGVATQLEGLVLRVPAYVPLTHPLLRDLNVAVGRRGGRLFGFPTAVRRDEGSRSAVQAAVDHCLLPAVLRRIESGDDFIAAYGRCLLEHKALKITALRPAPGQRLGVVLASAADDDLLKALNGSVRVPSEDGEVDVLVLAYPDDPGRIRLP